MSGRAAIARVLDDLPAGLVRWGAPPAIDRPLHPTGLEALDRVLGGGWPAGRLCTLRAGAPGLSGRTAVALASVADLTARGGVAAWIDGDGSLDPASLREAGADLDRVLWVRGPLTVSGLLAATDAVVRAGGFGMAVVRPPEAPGWAAHASSWLRVARVVERSRTTVLVLDRGDVASAHAAVRVGVSLDGASWWGTRGPGHVLAGALIRLVGPAGMADLTLWTPAARVFPRATGGQRRQSMLVRERDRERDRDREREPEQEPDRSAVSLR